nr:MAG TPA: hypothetical protein [Bacteriophage sp.]
MTLGFIMSMIVLHRLYSQLCYSIYNRKKLFLRDTSEG